MAAFANVVLTDTFDQWRIRSNEVITRLNSLSLTGNTLTVNSITSNTGTFQSSLHVTTSTATDAFRVTQSGAGAAIAVNKAINVANNVAVQWGAGTTKIVGNEAGAAYYPNTMKFYANNVLAASLTNVSGKNWWTFGDDYGNVWYDPVKFYWVTSPNLPNTIAATQLITANVVSGGTNYSDLFIGSKTAGVGGTLSSWRGVFVEPMVVQGADVITYGYGVYVGDTNYFTTIYGFYSNLSAGPGKYGIYTSTANNYFGGSTTISVSSSQPALRVTQTGAGVALVVEDSTNTDSSPFVVDTSGNVGIGTNSPSGPLHIARNADSSQEIYVRNSNSGSSAYTVLNIGNDSSSTALRLIVDSSTATSFGGAGSANFVNSLNTPMTFWTNNTERARISADGNFKINSLGPFNEFANTAINTGTAKTIPSDSNVVRYTLTNNVTFTLPSGEPALGGTDSLKSITVFVKQGGSGSYTVAWTPPGGETVSYNNSASAPPPATAVGAVSIYTCMKFGGDTNWYISLSYIDD